MGIFSIFSKKTNKESLVEDNFNKEESLQKLSDPEQKEIDKSGWVYIISNRGSFGPDIFKIGATRRKNPQDRVNELGDASVPFKFDVHAFIKCDNAFEVESQIHRFLKDKEVNKVNHKKEFYKTSLQEVKEIVEKLGFHVKWNFEQSAIDFERSKNL